jgi:tetratricopeptide (TPR) repeat protein
VSALALAVVLLATAPASEATVLVEEGRAHWERDEFLEAADAFERAHALDPQPDYLFARAQALRLAGRCDDAIAVYLRFLETAPPEDEVIEAKLRMAECQQTIIAEPTAEEPEGVVATAPPPIPPPRPTPEVDRPRVQELPRRDKAGGALVGTGSLVAAIGVGLVIGASQIAARADDATTERDYGNAFTRANRLSAIGISLASVGGALLLGGIVRYVVVAKQRRRGARMIRR